MLLFDNSQFYEIQGISHCSYLFNNLPYPEKVQGKYMLTIPNMSKTITRKMIYFSIKHDVENYS